jgi:hypothetical protein
VVVPHAVLRVSEVSLGRNCIVHPHPAHLPQAGVVQLLLLLHRLNVFGKLVLQPEALDLQEEEEEEEVSFDLFRSW